MPAEEGIPIDGIPADRSSDPPLNPAIRSAADDVFSAALSRLGLITAGETVSLTPLTGGVSSDIRLVVAGDRRFCAKRALPQLKVAQLWEVPITRNAAEARYLRRVSRWLPGFVPDVIAEDAAAGLFAMPWFAPESHPLWKSELLAGRIDVDFASAVGERLGRVHQRSAAEPGLRQQFDEDLMFEALRLAPYLRATGLRHPDLAVSLNTLADSTLATQRALVHGDVSPKNILMGPAGPVLLDAECAWFGDPAFDVAFCVNHLLLKGVRMPQVRARLVRAARALTDAYLLKVDWEPASTLQQRAAALLPALMLARVDGKSPVEYLTLPAQHDAIRQFTAPRIVRPDATLSAVFSAYDEFFGNHPLWESVGE